ncbi:MAG: LysM peptidoglycan-binding domain-containing protein [Chloroflexi bacterium]|nr:LysM peptidoglycan-binding domain-containing protein [Chloroflexota bacterium]
MGIIREKDVKQTIAISVIFLTTIFLITGCGSSATPTIKDTGRGVQSTTTLGKASASASVTAKLATPLSTASPTLAPTPTETVYTVQVGDSISKIAVKFGTTTQAIVTANKMDNPNLIKVGQQLIIPPSPTATAANLPAASPPVTTTKTAP